MGTPWALDWGPGDQAWGVLGGGPAADSERLVLHYDHDPAKQIVSINMPSVLWQSQTGGVCQGSVKSLCNACNLQGRGATSTNMTLSAVDTPQASKYTYFVYLDAVTCVQNITCSLQYIATTPSMQSTCSMQVQARRLQDSSCAQYPECGPGDLVAGLDPAAPMDPACRLLARPAYSNGDVNIT